MKMSLQGTRFHKVNYQEKLHGISSVVRARTILLHRRLKTIFMVVVGMTRLMAAKATTISKAAPVLILMLLTLEMVLIRCSTLMVKDLSNSVA